MKKSGEPTREYFVTGNENSGVAGPVVGESRQPPAKPFDALEKLIEEAPNEQDPSLGINGFMYAYQQWMKKLLAYAAGLAASGAQPTERTTRLSASEPEATLCSHSQKYICILLKGHDIPHEMRPGGCEQAAPAAGQADLGKVLEAHRWQETRSACSCQSATLSKCITYALYLEHVNALLRSKAGGQ